jgi:hypothetical protein
MPVELVVYDLDGTLVDSAPATVALLNQLRNELGLSSLPYDAFIPWLHFEKKNVSAQLSIDFNTSPLRIASNSYGGIECSLGYLIKYRKDGFNQYDFCPYIWF